MLPSTNLTPQTGSLAQVSQSTESQYINFDAAQNILTADQIDPEKGSTFFKPIYYVVGIDVDGSGNARNWIFGVRRSEGTVMLAYDGKSWTTIPWNAPGDLEEIPVDSILSPSRLFSKNAAVIAGNPPPLVPERRDLELKQGIYALTITSGNTSRILMFNATSGELIKQP